MYKINFITALLVVSQFVISQTKTISGIVLDAIDENPIIDAFIFIEDKSIGVITNENGNFKITFPSERKKLVISHIGYSKKILSIDEIGSGQQIFLEPRNFTLDEVIITQKKLEKDATLIMKKAFAKLSSNTREIPFFAQAFVRHTERSIDRYELLIEAVLEVYDPGLVNNPKGIKINVLQTRRSFDSRKIDTVKFYRTYLNVKNKSSYNKNYEAARNYKDVSKDEIQKAIAYYDDHYTSGYSKNKGLMDKLFATDINKLRYFNQKKASFNKKSLNNYSFELDSILRKGIESVYKVKFKRYSKKEKELSIGWLYVRSRDFAILELQFSQILGNSHHLRKIINGNLKYSTNIKFKEYGNVMYPFYISHKAFKLNQDLVRSIRGEEDLSYYTHEEILFSAIYTDEKKIEDFINNRFSWEWDSNIFKARSYDELFWSQQNTILESDKNQQMRIDLEKRVRLKEQFRKQ